MNANSLTLSPHGIEELQQLDCTKKEVKKVDITLQVHTVKRNEQSKQSNVFTVTMADMFEKYTGFLFMLQGTQTEPQLGDILRITGVTVAMLNKDKTKQTKIFLIKNYTTLSSHHPFLSNPELSENKSKKRDVPQMEDQHQPHFQKPNQVREGGFDSSTCQLLSHLTTFTKDIHLYVKVTKKTDIKKFTNRTNHQPGQLFSFNIVDVEGFEMQVTAFGNACERIYPIITEGNVYEIIGGYVKINDRKYSTVKSDYKLMLEDSTRINEVEDNGGFKEIKLNFVKFSDIPSLTVGSLIDCVGIVIETSERTLINTKNGEQNLRRIRIGDISGYKIEMTLWRSFADLDIRTNSILVFKGVRIGEFNGKNLGTVDATVVQIDPQLPEVDELRAYVSKGNIWSTLPSTGSLTENSGPIEISYIKDIINQLDNNLDDRSVGLSKFKATAITINHSEKFYYPGCPEKNCKKKLTQENSGWICQSCNKTYEKPFYYYTISLRVEDASDTHWIDIFGDVGAKFLGVPAEEYKDLIINKDETRLREITEKIEFQKFMFIGKAKVQIYNNMTKKRINVYRFEVINEKEEARHNIRMLNALLLNKFD